MILDNAVEIIPANPDSQYRLVRCKCGSDNVAYSDVFVIDAEAVTYDCIEQKYRRD